MSAPDELLRVRDRLIEAALGLSAGAARDEVAASLLAALEALDAVIATCDREGRHDRIG